MSGITPPHPIAEFPDHPYIRGEDVIRPTPRRLVDMRKSASANEVPSRIAAGAAQRSVTVSGGPYTSELPPILPAKPFGMLKGDSFFDDATHLSRITTSTPKSIHVSQPTKSPLYLPLELTDHLSNSPQRSFVKGFSLNQRSVPNIPQLIQPISANNMYTATPTPAYQQPARIPSSTNVNPHPPQPLLQNNTKPRPFLSPQPNDTNRPPIISPRFRNSSDNLIDNDDDPSTMHYYSELKTVPPPTNSTSPGFRSPHPGLGYRSSYDNAVPKPPRVGIEWKSVDHLQKHGHPCFTAANNDTARHEFNEHVVLPKSSPEYDRIKSPSEIAQDIKSRIHAKLSGQYVPPDPRIQLNSNQATDTRELTIRERISAFDRFSKIESQHPLHKLPDVPSTHVGNNDQTARDSCQISCDLTGKVIEYPKIIAKVESPSKRKLATPFSKLKSRRKNIFHNLSPEEIQLLNAGATVPNTYANSGNTGTGGSTSDGSSGHASMTDSQISASPPVEYGTITSNGPISQLSPSGPNAILSNVPYKSMLKSVPEDELSGPSNPSFDKKKNGENTSDRKSLDTSVSAEGKKSTKSKHRNKELTLLCNGNSGLEDIEAIEQAIEQLTIRSGHGGGHHSSYSTSTYSSMSGSECGRHRKSHLIRYSSHDTINTQVTSADEFVWVDSNNRLVELQQVPWSNHDILKVVEKSSRLKDSLERISMEAVPRVSYLLQRAFVRIARETQRLAKPFGFCSKQEVASALKIVLSPALADSCSKACLRAAAMFAVSTIDPLQRESKSARAGLNLHVGRFHRWMIDVRLGRFVHEFAAVHLTASIENLIEEILGQALSHITMNSEGNHQGTSPVLTAALQEQAISHNGDLWGLLQPYSHLNAGRIASGALALPRRWASVASVESGSSSSTIGPSPQDDSSLSGRTHNHSKSLEQSLLTTCVGSVSELSDILSLVSKVHYKQLPLSTTNNGIKAVAPSWSPTAVQTLFYFMRCSQLENADDRMGSNGNLGSSTVTLGNESIDRSQHHAQTSRVPAQELVYERPFIVLPPIMEWVRVATAHADHRHSTIVDKDDVMQAARLLLPGIDCPPRFISSDEFFWPRRPIDEFECNRRLKIDLAFKMLTSGRSDLVAQALLLMPPSKANTFNECGLSPLILASIRGEEAMVKVLLEAGADPNGETPANSPNFPQANSETQHWTSLTFAALMGHSGIVKILLEKSANVEGGAKVEEQSTQSPLQVACASGAPEIVSSLLAYGANPFLSTLVRDSLCYTGSAQRGSFSAISIAASHGHRTIIHKLLAHPFNQPSSNEVLSLEEILAEGVQPGKTKYQQGGKLNNGRPEEPRMLSKTQLKVLQEAMYQSAENGHLDITWDIRNLGVPWTLHCWMKSMSTAYEMRCEAVIDQLLQDFLRILHNEDFSQAAFIEDCVPLLFTIFRNSKNEKTTILLAEIFQTCYGKDAIKEIRDTSISNGARIDPKYVNNPELSDVQFRVEGRVFYAHKIVLVTSSQRFKSMLKGAPDSNPPVLQINDIRYPIFQMVMEYLYNGTAECIRNIEADDVLELMAAANFFQLDGLIRFCEAKCSQKLSIDSIVSMYIHAKVYDAVQLLEYCQGFLLQSMVELLSYDDSVSRLIFGKKLHNHDVLAGLLLTLQARLKSRPTSTPSRKSK